jgi:hypothetical protein
MDSVLTKTEGELRIWVEVLVALQSIDVQCNRIPSGKKELYEPNTKMNVKKLRT